MIARLCAATFLLMAAAACSMSVQGVVQGTDETFTGKATAGIDGSGTLNIVSNKGPTCSGRFVYETDSRGAGVFICSDGRSGPFQFVATISGGVGGGTLGDRNFTFTFGY